MKTRDKILQHSLELFNHSGEASVGMMDIAQAMEISPGNLYYHFSSKEAILMALFDQLQNLITPRLDDLALQLAGIENQPWVIDCLLAGFWQYRFAFLDSYRLAQRYPRLKRRLQNLRAKTRLAFAHWVDEIEIFGLITLPSAESKILLIENLCLISTSWLTHAGFNPQLPLATLQAQALAQIMALITAYCIESPIHDTQADLVPAVSE